MPSRVRPSNPPPTPTPSRSLGSLPTYITGPQRHATATRGQGRHDHTLTLVDCVNLTRLALVTGQVACPSDNIVRHSDLGRYDALRNRADGPATINRAPRLAQHPEAVTAAHWPCPSPSLHCSSLDAAEGRAGAEARLRDAWSIRGEAFRHTRSIHDVECSKVSISTIQYSMHDSRIVSSQKHRTAPTASVHGPTSL
jgi:hypothetical protein